MSDMRNWKKEMLFGKSKPQEETKENKQKKLDFEKYKKKEKKEDDANSKKDNN